MDTHTTRAVSPVVSVMLMLVVTIIIAAIVSAFAGGITSSQSKTPQAKISATFSVSGGMTITHSGGDAIPLNDLVFITQNGDGFGPNAQKVTTQKLDLSLIADKDGNQVFVTDRIAGKTSFNPGDTLYISAYNCTCSILQYSVSSPLFTDTEQGDSPHCYESGNPWDWANHPLSYSGSCPGLWQLCFRNPNNVGKVFNLQTSDKDGNLISKTEVKIVP
jgi:archaeal type IV pilus assembly protein PilA